MPPRGSRAGMSDLARRLTNAFVKERAEFERNDPEFSSLSSLAAAVAMQAASASSTHSSSPSASSPPTPTNGPLMMPVNRPPKCRIANCELTFESYYKREIHERTHFGGEVPFPCPVQGCKKGYNVIRSLHSHIRARHPEKMEVYGVPPISKAGTTPEMSLNANAPSLINPRAALHVSQNLQTPNPAFSSDLSRTSPLLRAVEAATSGSGARRRGSPDGSVSPRRRDSSASSSSYYSRSSPSSSPPPEAARSLAALRRSPESSLSALPAHLRTHSTGSASSIGQKRASLSNILDPSLPNTKRARLSPHASPDTKPFSLEYARLVGMSRGSSSPPPLISSNNSSSRSSVSPEREHRGDASANTSAMVLRKRRSSRGADLYPQVTTKQQQLSPTLSPQMSMKVMPPPADDFLSKMPKLKLVHHGQQQQQQRHYHQQHQADAARDLKMSHLSDILRRHKISDAAPGAGAKDFEGDVTMMEAAAAAAADSKKGVRSFDLSRVAPPPEEEEEEESHHHAHIGFASHNGHVTSHRRVASASEPRPPLQPPAAAIPTSSASQPPPPHHELMQRYAHLQQINDYLKMKLSQKTALLEEAERVIHTLAPQLS